MDEQRLILIVEDDEATRAFLAENIAADGFRVASATSAAEGLRAIEVRRPSLVLLDLALEGAAGSTCSTGCAPRMVWRHGSTLTFR